MELATQKFKVSKTLYMYKYKYKYMYDWTHLFLRRALLQNFVIFKFHIYTLYYVFPISGKIISSYIGKLSHSLETIRMGYSLALGALPRRFVSGKLDCVLAGLFKASKIDDKCMSMAEARRDAVKAVVRWVKYIKQAPSVKASIYILDILAFTRSLTG